MLLLGWNKVLLPFVESDCHPCLTAFITAQTEIISDERETGLTKIFPCGRRTGGGIVLFKKQMKDSLCSLIVCLSLRKIFQWSHYVIMPSLVQGSSNGCLSETFSISDFKKKLPVIIVPCLCWTLRCTK